MSTEPQHPVLSGEPLEHDGEVAAGFRYILTRMGWRVSDLARAAGLSPAVTHRMVMGYETNTVTLRRLCRSLGVEVWLFWLIADFEVSKDDPSLARAKAERRITREVAEAYQAMVPGIHRLLAAKVGAKGSLIAPRSQPSEETAS